jgi:predicted CopG family antitoxin
MAVKTITITEEAYNALKCLKKSDQSFSEIIIEVAEEKKGDISRFFGILKGSKAMDDLRKNLKRYRMQADLDARKREEKIRNKLYDNR